MLSLIAILREKAVCRAGVPSSACKTCSFTNYKMEKEGKFLTFVHRIVRFYFAC
jgi:hypothetical protein